MHARYTRITNRAERYFACARTQQQLLLSLCISLFFVAFKSVLFGLGFNTITHNSVQYLLDKQ